MSHPPEADSQKDEKKNLVEGIPEIFEKPRVEIDAKKGEAKSLERRVVMAQAGIDGPAGDCGKKQCPVEEFNLLGLLPDMQIAMIAEDGKQPEGDEKIKQPHDQRGVGKKAFFSLLPQPQAGHRQEPAKKRKA